MIVLARLNAIISVELSLPQFRTIHYLFTQYVAKLARLVGWKNSRINLEVRGWEEIELETIQEKI